MLNKNSKIAIMCDGYESDKYLAAAVVYLLLSGYNVVPFDKKDIITVPIKAAPPLPELKSVSQTSLHSERGVIPDKFKPKHKRRW